MAERGFGGAQGPLAQDPAMGVHQGEGGVVADRADVAEVVGDPLEFGHHAAKIVRARRRLDPERRLDRAGESDAIGDRRVAADPRREDAGALDAAPRMRASTPLCT